jgi:glyoxylase-like metal-dependent hydrolase (beta-lactamase superfamily II)
VNRTLRHKVFVTKQIPQSGRGPLPDGSTRMWSPITSTLIMGRHDAALIDPPMTIEQAGDVGDWIAASGRDLRQIYITHGHGDHWFGAIPLLQRFPDVTLRATEGTAKLMEAQNDPTFRAEFWDRVFPGQLPVGEPDVTVVDERGFELDGVAMLPVEVGHTDTDATTMLHVPEMGLLVAGDVVYNGVHLRHRRVARRARHGRIVQGRNGYCRSQESPGGGHAMAHRGHPTVSERCSPAAAVG